jgi:SNF2 family DNA or RNA helicase
LLIYLIVLVLLLRLRQICGHPSLIQEDGVSYIAPDELDDDKQPEVREELSRARQLVSPEFVTKIRETLKQKALLRIAAEKEVSLAEKMGRHFIDKYSSPRMRPSRMKSAQFALICLLMPLSPPALTLFVAIV